MTEIILSELETISKRVKFPKKPYRFAQNKQKKRKHMKKEKDYVKREREKKKEEFCRGSKYDYRLYHGRDTG